MKKILTLACVATAFLLGCSADSTFSGNYTGEFPSNPNPPLNPNPPSGDPTGTCTVFLEDFSYNCYNDYTQADCLALGGFFYGDMTCSD